MSFGNLVIMKRESDAIQMLEGNPDLTNFRFKDGSSLLWMAISTGCDRLALKLISPDSPYLNETVLNSTPLELAIDKDKPTIVEAILKAGANVQLGRPVFRTKTVKSGLVILKLLLKYGVDINQVFAMFGDKERQMSALDFFQDRPDLLDEIKSSGAKSAKEILLADPQTIIHGAE